MFVMETWEPWRKPHHQEWVEKSTCGYSGPVAALGVGNQGGCPGRHLLGGHQNPKMRTQIEIKPPILLRFILKPLKIWINRYLKTVSPGSNFYIRPALLWTHMWYWLTNTNQHSTSVPLTLPEETAMIGPCPSTGGGGTPISGETHSHQNHQGLIGTTQSVPEEEV